MPTRFLSTRANMAPFRRLLRPWQQLLHNPVALKEWRSRMRGRRAVTVLTVYLAILAAIVLLIFGIYRAQSQTPFGPEPQRAGQPVTIAVLVVQTFLVVFIGPAFAAGAISGEVERQTYDLLRTTLLPARSLATGKLSAAVSYVLLLLLTTVPVLSLAFLLGGVSFEQIAVAQLVLIVAAFQFAAWGLYASAAMRSTLASTVMTFGGSVFFLLALPLAALVGVSVIGFATAFAPDGSALVEAAGLYAGTGAAALNLPAALIASQVVLEQFNTIWFYPTTFTDLTGSYTFYYPSPWLLYVPINTFLAWVLWRLTVRRIRRRSGG